jgi:hypothetical protein
MCKEWWPKNGTYFAPALGRKDGCDRYDRACRLEYMLQYREKQKARAPNIKKRRHRNELQPLGDVDPNCPDCHIPLEQRTDATLGRTLDVCPRCGRQKMMTGRIGVRKYDQRERAERDLEESVRVACRPPRVT